jgi:hypothetical protein
MQNLSGGERHALEWLERCYLSAPAYSWSVPTLANALVLLDRTEEARALLEKAHCDRTKQYVPATTLALLHAVVGSTGEALRWFEIAFEESDPILPSLPRGNVGIFIMPELELPVRKSERWQHLVRAMRLE